MIPFNRKQVLIEYLTTGYSFEDPAKLYTEKLRVERERKNEMKNEMRKQEFPTAKDFINSIYGRMNYNGMYQSKRSLSDYIFKVIFNDPATIVFWKDGTKTIVKAEGEPFDPEKGMAMACAKKLGFNNGNYYEAFKEWLPVKDEPLNVGKLEDVFVSAIKGIDNLTVGISRLTAKKKTVQLLSAKQLAEKIGCSPKRIAKECREGKHPGAKKIHGVWQIPFEDLVKDTRK